MTTKPFGTLLRDYRLEAGLTQEQLGLRCGMEGAAVRRHEKPSKTRPQLMTILRLAAGLGLRLHDEKTLRLLEAAGRSNEAGAIGEALLKSGATIEEAFTAQVNWAAMLFEQALAELTFFHNCHGSELPRQLGDDIHDLNQDMTQFHVSLRHYFWKQTLPEEERKKVRRRK